MIIFSDKNYSSFLLKIVFSQNIYKNNLNITSYFFLRLITSIKKKIKYTNLLYCTKFSIASVYH